MPLTSFNTLSRQGLSQPSPYLLDVAARQCVGNYQPNPEYTNHE